MATPIEERALEERVTRLEGAYEHLATKADFARLKGVMDGVEKRIVRWMVAAAVISVPVAVTIATVLNKLLIAS